MKFNKNDVLVIIDMQNDFIDGALANPAAKDIVWPICQLIEMFPGDIICTRDTHDANYLKSPEGKKLPIEHCISQTAGWCINDDIQKALRTKTGSIINKPTFGSLEWAEDHFAGLRNKTIYLVGTCTDICVISNALILKAVFPEADIKVIGDLCAGLTKEKHEAALEVMRSCQIDVITTGDDYFKEKEVNA